MIVINSESLIYIYIHIWPNLALFCSFSVSSSLILFSFCYFSLLFVALICFSFRYFSGWRDRRREEGERGEEGV